MANRKGAPRFNPRAGDRRGTRQLGGRPSSSLWYGLAFLLLLGMAQMYFLTPSGRAIHRGGGADRDRTDDLLNAIQALSQLSYSPNRTAFR